MSSCRLIVDRPASGSWNMAVDEALLHSAAGLAVPTFRLYAWAPATLSLGYFQSYADRSQHRPSANCPFVRRRSGGGAILHDAEITYALVLPISHPAARDPLALYRGVHQGVVKVLQCWGVDAELYAAEPRENQFLCFHRRSPGDLVVDSCKVMGSAQRRTASALLQHGSLLIRQSTFAPSLPGIADLTRLDVDPFQRTPELVDAILAGLGFMPKVGSLTTAEATLAQRVENEKFATLRWNQKR